MLGDHSPPPGDARWIGDVEFNRFSMPWLAATAASRWLRRRPAMMTLIAQPVQGQGEAAADARPAARDEDGVA